MPTMAEIEAVGRRIGEAHHAAAVILFGSHARGTANPDSDVDLLVILPFEGSRAARAAAIRAGLHLGFALDLLVRTPAEVSDRLALGDPFVTEVLRQGRWLYGSADQ